jgi:NAD(P)-dependent dehydrogenase (short-subunit alcohol dehydrogenase family)
MGLLDGKAALVTGGSSGIGQAIAAAFAREGCSVAISGRRADALAAAAKEIGSDTVTIVGDVADPHHHTVAAEQVAERFGRIDIYVANAGINTIQHTSDVSLADYERQFATNARGTFFGVKAVSPILRDGGAIVLVGSLASEKVLAGHAVYAGTKAAIGAFARNWAVEFKDRGIRVNVLSPGPTDTAILEKLGVPPEDREAFEAGMAAAIPLGRFGKPDELASAALFLASPAAAFVTGINLRVDGGMALL